MTDYRYRRMAYELVTEQRDEIMKECKENYKKKPDKTDRFLKNISGSIFAFFNTSINK